MTENISITIEEIDQDSEIALSEIFAFKKKKKKDKGNKPVNSTELELNSNTIEIKDTIEIKYTTEIKDTIEIKDTTEIKEKKSFIQDIWDPPTYTYDYLLNKLYENLERSDTKINQKFTVKMPIVQRLGAKKTAWINFIDCAKNINREKTHLQTFINSELSTEGNIDGNGYLLIKGIYNQKNIESILRKYVSSYVQCPLCKSLDTTIEKNNVTRLSLLVCSNCKSSRTLQQTNTEYKSSVKTKK